MSTMPQKPVRLETLEESLDRVYEALARAAQIPTQREHNQPPVSADPCFALERLRTTFALSSFECDLLVLSAGASLESRFVSACAAAHHNPEVTSPTFGLALAILDDAHWSVISRARPLRYWRMIEVGDAPLLHAPLRIDERILQFLIGVPAVDERLEALVRPLDLKGEAGSPTNSLNASETFHSAVRHWTGASVSHEPILLVSNRGSTRRAAFMELCRQANLRPYALNAADIPATPTEREQFARLWTREFVLAGGALSIQTDDADNSRNLTALLSLLETPVAIEVEPGSAAEHLEGLRIHLNTMSAPERKRVWTEELGPVAQGMNGSLDRIAEHFQFDRAGIRASALLARQELARQEPAQPAQPELARQEMESPAETDAGGLVWRICRRHARRSLENLAQRLDGRGAWDDLVLPAQQTAMLRQIVIHVRQRAVVNEHWGFAARYERGLGLSVLFTGVSGTGKTMAAEIIAGELDLDLYRIDLASVVSKYIGETEKNLRRIFDAAEESSAILLFDEADALFGKRSEVRDSHDRYANLEVSYLLQRVESYRGIAILTTNLQHALDAAFMRRIRFIVQFPFPDALSRSRIWQRIYPSATPVGEMDFDRLAQLNISGGVIRNIAMHAAFLAAEDQRPVSMAHLLQASRSEYSKMDRPLTAAETRGWA